MTELNEMMKEYIIELLEMNGMKYCPFASDIGNVKICYFVSETNCGLQDIKTEYMIPEMGRSFFKCKIGEE